MTKAYLFSECMIFVYFYWYFMLSLFKFLQEKYSIERPILMLRFENIVFLTEIWWTKHELSIVSIINTHKKTHLDKKKKMHSYVTTLGITFVLHLSRLLSFPVVRCYYFCYLLLFFVICYYLPILSYLSVSDMSLLLLLVHLSECLAISFSQF